MLRVSREARKPRRQRSKEAQREGPHQGYVASDTARAATEEVNERERKRHARSFLA